jgi:hypothetical protein
MSDPAKITELHSIKQVFDNHLLILCCIEGDKANKKRQTVGHHKTYSKDSLCQLLVNEDWSMKSDVVQGMRDIFKN